ncbi:MAG: 50S ribosomal protein L23 [bacterium]
MATTKTKKNTKEVVDVVAAKEVKTNSPILGPRITEKSAKLSETGAYVFNVKNKTNKNEIKKAIKAMYGVTPERVAITIIADKTVMRRGVEGTKAGGKKAVVYLKKGDKIAL